MYTCASFFYIVLSELFFSSLVLYCNYLYICNIINNKNMAIKAEKIIFTVTVDVICTDPDNFECQEHFLKEDLKDMKIYLSETIRQQLDGKWQFAAKVKNVKVNAHA